MAGKSKDSKSKVTKDFADLTRVETLKKNEVAIIEYSIPQTANGKVLSRIKDSNGHITYSVKNEDGRTISVKEDWITNAYVE